MSMRQVEYVDERGRKYLVRIPADASEEEAHMGVRLGPPDVVDATSLPDDLKTALHNELYERRLFSISDVKKYPGVLESALKTILKADVNSLLSAYHSNP